MLIPGPSLITPVSPLAGLYLNVKDYTVANISKTGGGLNNPGTGTRGAETGEFAVGGRRQLTYSATIATDLANPSRRFWISATNGTAFTISNPSNYPIAYAGDDQVSYEIQNAAGGALGVLTWGAQFKLAGAWTQPASGKKRTITFYYDPVNTLWIELARAAADI